MIDADELRAAFEECRELGQLTNRAAQLAGEVAKMRTRCRGMGLSEHDRREVVAEFYWQLLQRWEDIDPGRNVYGYLLGMVSMVLKRRRRGRTRMHSERVWEEERRRCEVLTAELGRSPLSLVTE